MSEVNFKCRQCRHSSKRYNDWRKHLLEERHQVQSRQRVKMMDLKNKKRSLVVFGLTSVKKEDILKYFGDLALITDFVFWNGTPGFCVIKFLTKQFCKTILLAREHNIKGQNLFLRSRADISDVEWISICPFGATNIKIEVDLAETTLEDPFIDSSEESDDDRNDEILTSDHATAAVTSDIRDAQMVVPELQDLPSEEISQSPINSKQLGSELQQSMSQNQDDSEMREIDSVPANFQNFESKNNSDENMTVNKVDIENMNSASTNHQEEHEDVEMLEEFVMPESRSTIEGDIGDRFVFDLNGQMENLYNANLMAPDAWQLRCRVKEGVEILLSAIYPNCVLIPFGEGSSEISSGQEFGEMLSMFVDTMGSTKYESIDSAVEKEIHMELSSAMKDKARRKILRLLEENVMISDIASKDNSNQNRSMEKYEIQFRYFDAEQHVSILCRLIICRLQKDFITAQCYRLTKFYCGLDHRVRPLLILGCQWAYNNQLVQPKSHNERTEAKCIRPAVIHWLTICYLIKKKILPPLPLLQKYSITFPMHGDVGMGMKLIFCDDLKKLKWKHNGDYEYEKDPVTGNPSARCILELARNMFSFYGKIKLEKCVVMTGLGRLIRKDILSGEKDVLQDSYYWKRTKKMNMDSSLCVQHPLKLYCNMTSNVHSSMKNIFQNACLKTASRLQDLLLNSSRMCNLMTLLSNHQEIVWHHNETHSCPSSSSVFVGQENGEPQNVIESDVHALSDIAVPKNKTFKKLKNFEMNLAFTKKFREAAKQVTEPRMKAALDTSLKAVWLKFFNDFNKIVWPLCFGIKITELPDETNVDDETGMYGKPYGLPFKGVLQNPSKLSWVITCAKLNKNSIKDSVFKGKLLEYFKMLRRSSIVSRDDIDIDDSLSGIISNMFHFQYRIFIEPKEKSKTNIDYVNQPKLIKVSNICGSFINSEKRKELVFKMYSELWDMYSFNRSINDRCFFLDDE